MTKPRDQMRERQTGRYGYVNQWERLCRCGHTLGVHTAEPPHECIARDFDRTATSCGCMKFRPKR